jgi:hypothetical protein
MRLDHGQKRQLLQVHQLRRDKRLQLGIRSMALQPEFCDFCSKHLDPGEEIIQGIEQVTVSSWGDALPTYIEGVTVIFHPAHWPTASWRWRELYRGPLTGIRPEAS